MLAVSLRQSKLTLSLECKTDVTNQSSASPPTTETIFHWSDDDMAEGKDVTFALESLLTKGARPARGLGWRMVNDDEEQALCPSRQEFD